MTHSVVVEVLVVEISSQTDFHQLLRRKTQKQKSFHLSKYPCLFVCLCVSRKYIYSLKLCVSIQLRVKGKEMIEYLWVKKGKILKCWQLLQKQQREREGETFKSLNLIFEENFAFTTSKCNFAIHLALQKKLPQMMKCKFYIFFLNSFYYMSH